MDAGDEYEVSGIDDGERTDFMFSDFPTNRNINPKHWESKIKFWTTEIENSCRFHGDFCVNCEKLRVRFRDRNRRSPKGLMIVIGDLYQSSVLLMRSDYIDLIDETWGQWSYNVAKKTSLWAWRKAWYGGYNEQTMFVVRDILEKNASSLLQSHYKTVKYEKTDNIVPWNVIKNVYKINGRALSEENLICVIGYLKSKGKCKVAMSDTGEKIVKFKSKEQGSVDPVVVTDFEIVKLKKSIAKLHLESTQAERDVKRLQENAQAHIRNKEKEKAMKVLAQKKKMNKTLTLKQNALFSMKEHLRTVQEAETTKMIADAFTSSATLLNQSYRQQGLTVENIDDAIDKVSEANEMINEVDDALSSGLKNLGDDTDMDELEKELEGLIAEPDDIDESIGVDELPDIPSISPVKSTPKKSKVPQRTLNPMPAM